MQSKCIALFSFLKSGITTFRVALDDKRGVTAQTHYCCWVGFYRDICAASALMCSARFYYRIKLEEMENIKTKAFAANWYIFSSKLWKGGEKKTKVCWRGDLLDLFMFAFLEHSWSIKIERVEVPRHPVVGGRTDLVCPYILETDRKGQTESLYSVKWYKDGHEFYR